jgi:hypothetical protein
MMTTEICTGEYFLLEMSDQEINDYIQKVREHYSQKVEWTDEDRPTISQIANCVCEYYGIPRDELEIGRQLRYLTLMRKSIAFLAVKIYDPESLPILAHGFYHKKIKKGLRIEISKIIHREFSTVSHIIRGAVREYDTDKEIQLLFNYFNHKLYEQHGKGKGIKKVEDRLPRPERTKTSRVQSKKGNSKRSTGHSKQSAEVRNVTSNNSKQTSGKS